MEWKCASEIYSDRMRCSVILLGATSWQKPTERVIGYPGGCVIGKRPIDLHLYALKTFWVRIISEENGKIHGQIAKS